MPIFDQGYQHWSGNLSSHAWRWLAITRRGVRVGMKLPRLRRMVFITWLPALALATFLCLWGLIEQKSDRVSGILRIMRFLGPEILADPKHFRIAIWTLAYTIFMEVELWSSMVMILLVGPNLISQDLRFNALPLYFSRPLRRIDYFFGKLGVVGAFLGLTIVAPALIAYILGILFSLDVTILSDTLPILIGAVIYGLLIVVSAGTLILALSSLSRNSRYISILWAAVLIVTSALSTILVDVEQLSRVQAEQAAMIQSSFGQMGNDLQKTLDDIEEQHIAADKVNWRYLVSYIANLRRVGQKLLGTNDAWDSIREIQVPMRRLDFRMNVMGPEYPWYWSAGVLLALFGLSVCILHFRVRSLDRLK